MRKLLLAFTAVLVPTLAALLALFGRLDADVGTWLAKEPPGFYDGKVVWITGASSGIGEALARELSAKNAKLVLSARRLDELNRVKDSLFGRHEALVLPFDMTDEAYHPKAVEAVLETWGSVDILVLNAGRTQRSVVWETDAETVRKIFEVNLFSVISLTRQVLPVFLQQGSGHFVVTSSFSGKLATPLSSTYASTKHALHGLFDSLRAEVADRGVQVTIACPGPVVSEIGLHAIVHNAGRDYDIQSSQKRMPTQRCAELMAKGVATGLEELWICDQPLLTLYYVGQYAPALYRLWAKFLGPARVQVFKAGGDDYDLKQVIAFAKKKGKGGGE